MKKIFLYIGTYTSNTKSKGIYLFHFDLDSGQLSDCIDSISTSNPSYITSSSSNILYSISEVDQIDGVYGGSINSFLIDRKTGELSQINSKSTKGAYPCHVSIDNLNKYVLVSNYMGGSIIMYPISEKGIIQNYNSYNKYHGSSKGNIERQEGPHPHSSAFTSDKKHLLIADLGKDMLIGYRVNLKGELTFCESLSIKLQKGQGPRHMTFHPNGKYFYLINELGNSINAYQYKTKSTTLEFIEKISTLPKKFDKENLAADIHIHPNGKYLFASNRGHDSIAIFSINQHNGHLKLIDHQSTFGKHPRNFSIDPRGNYLLVANKDSNNVVVFKINKESGKLTKLSTVLDVPSPTCVDFF